MLQTTDRAADINNYTVMFSLASRNRLNEHRLKYQPAHLGRVVSFPKMSCLTTATIKTKSQ